jgi:homoserine dehydrogenase
VIADLVDIARQSGVEPAQRVPALAFQPDAMSDLRVLPMGEVVTSYYLRLRVMDEAGVLARVTGILADLDISIDAVLQRPAEEAHDAQPGAASSTDLIILTHDCPEAKMNAALELMQAQPAVLAPITRIRKEELA